MAVLMCLSPVHPALASGYPKPADFPVLFSPHHPYPWFSLFFLLRNLTFEGSLVLCISTFMLPANACLLSLPKCSTGTHFSRRVSLSAHLLPRAAHIQREERIFRQGEEKTQGALNKGGRKKEGKPESKINLGNETEWRKRKEKKN